MTQKRIIIVLSILAVIATLLLVSSLVFKVKTIDVVISGEETSLNAEDILNKSGLKKGNNIFVINKNKAINNIEKNIPTAKVISITSKFPNKLIINVSKRVKEFYIKHETETTVEYLIVDNDLKILEEPQSNIPTELCELKISVNTTEVARKLDNGNAISVINNLEIFGFDANKVNRNFVSIEFLGDDLVIKTKVSTTITVKKYAENLKEKMQQALSKYLIDGSDESVYDKDIIQN